MRYNYIDAVQPSAADWISQQGSFTKVYSAAKEYGSSKTNYDAMTGDLISAITDLTGKLSPVGVAAGTYATFDRAQVELNDKGKLSDDTIQSIGGAILGVICPSKTGHLAKLCFSVQSPQG